MDLRVVAPYELGFIAALAPIYLRAECYLMQGAADRAAEEFERILSTGARTRSRPFTRWRRSASLEPRRCSVISARAGRPMRNS